MKRSILYSLLILCISTCEVGASARQPQAASGPEGAELQLKVCVAERQVPLTQQLLSADSVNLNQVNQKIQHALQSALQRKGIATKECGDAVHEGSQLLPDLCAIVSAYNSAPAGELAFVIKNAFTPAVQGNMRLVIQQWNAYFSVLSEASSVKPIWPHKPALLKKWNDSQFMKAPGVYQSDRVECGICKAAHTGLEPWQDPGYYHEKECPYFKPFPFDNALDNLSGGYNLPHIFQALDMLGRGNNKTPEELQSPDIKAIASLWKNFKAYAAVAPDMLSNVTAALKAYAQQAARHGLSFAPSLRVTTYRLEEGKCRNDE